MRIVFLSPDEPFYLPYFYRYVFEHLSSEHEVQVVIVPPVYKNTTKLELALRYAKVFGVEEAAYLSWKVVYYKIMDSLEKGNQHQFYSLLSAIKRYNISVRFETDVNSEWNINIIRDWKTDIVISVSCPQILKQKMISAPTMGCLNLHGSLLPDYRGVMPSFWALSNNEKEAGVTLFFVNDKIDAGDILVQRQYKIEDYETLDAIIRRSKLMGAEIVLEGIKKINTGYFKTHPLNLKQGRYFGWPRRADVKRFRKNGKRFR